MENNLDITIQPYRGERKINIPTDLFNKHVASYRSKTLRIEKMIFLFGFDITEDGRVFYKDTPNLELYREVLNGVVVFNPIINGEKFLVGVHRLQGYKKFGSKMFKKDVIVIRKDSDIMNTHIDNMKLGSQSDRMMMIPQEQRQSSAEHAASHNIKYDHKAVLVFYDATKSYVRTMKEFGIASKSTLNNIIKNRDKALAVAK